MLQVSLWLLLLSHQFQRRKPSGRAEMWWFDNLCISWFLIRRRSRDSAPPPWTFHWTSAAPRYNRHRLTRQELKIKYKPPLWKEWHKEEAAMVLADTYGTTNKLNSFSNTPSGHGGQSSSVFKHPGKKKSPKTLSVFVFLTLQSCSSQTIFTCFQSVISRRWFSLVMFSSFGVIICDFAQFIQMCKTQNFRFFSFLLNTYNTWRKTPVEVSHHFPPKFSVFGSYFFTVSWL